MKRASFIQSLSLILGGMATTASLPFEDGPNHVIVGSNIQTIDNILSEHIKDKRHLKMFQHMLPSWVKSNKIDVSKPYFMYRNSSNNCALYAIGLFIFLSWNSNDGLTVAHLIEDYPDIDSSKKTKELYEKRLMDTYNCLKETQTA